MAAALAVADRVGPQGVTIRAVARQVGAPPMSLYTHFSNRDELIDLVYAEMVRHFFQDSGNPTWQGELMAVCRRIYTTFLEHPKWVPLLSRSATPVDVPLRERILAMMADDGIPPEVGFGIISSSSLATTGFAVAQLTYLEERSDSSLSERYRVLRDGSTITTMAPLTRQAVSVKQELPMREVFERTLTALVRGFELTARQADQSP